MSSGGAKASNWILSQFESYGLNCTQTHFLPAFAPLVQCTIEGTDPSAGTFVLGAHFDSRGTFGVGVAPGGDDDGSGTAAILSIARHISKHGLKFEKKISTFFPFSSSSSSFTITFYTILIASLFSTFYFFFFFHRLS